MFQLPFDVFQKVKRQRFCLVIYFKPILLTGNGTIQFELSPKNEQFNDSVVQKMFAEPPLKQVRRFIRRKILFLLGICYTYLSFMYLDCYTHIFF